MNKLLQEVLTNKDMRDAEEIKKEVLALTDVGAPWQD